MYAGTIYWARIGRVVYALSEQKMRAVIGPRPDNLTLDLPCRAVFATAQPVAGVVVPLPEDDAEAVGLHDGTWDH